ETLFETSRRLIEERDPDKVVASVLDGAIEATGAERGFVLLSPESEAEPEPLDAQEQATRRELPGGLRVAAARNFDRAEVRRPEFKVSRTVIEKALASSKPVVVRDAAVDVALSEHSSVIESKLRSIACVPI